MTVDQANHEKGDVSRLENQARVTQGHLLQTVDAIMKRRAHVMDSVRHAKSVFHLLPLAMAGFGALVAVGVGAASFREPTSHRSNSFRRDRPRTSTLPLLGVALFVGILAGLRVARRRH